MSQGTRRVTAIVGALTVAATFIIFPTTTSVASSAPQSVTRNADSWEPVTGTKKRPAAWGCEPITVFYSSAALKRAGIKDRTLFRSMKWAVRQIDIHSRYTLRVRAANLEVQDKVPGWPIITHRVGRPAGPHINYLMTHPKAGRTLWSSGYDILVPWGGASYDAQYNKVRGWYTEPPANVIGSDTVHLERVYGSVAAVYPLADRPTAQNARYNALIGLLYAMGLKAPPNEGSSGRTSVALTAGQKAGLAALFTAGCMNRPPWLEIEGRPQRVPNGSDLYGE